MAAISCYRCRDMGERGGCPECGKDTICLTKIPVEEVEAALTDIHIPMYYRTVEWDMGILKEAHAEKQTRKDFVWYCDQLDKVVNIFKNGEVPKQSAIFIAPAQHAKLIFAYTCLRHAISHGHSVVPIIDNTEFKRLNILSADRPTSQYLKSGEPTIDAYVNADVFFMTIDKDNFQGAMRTILSVVDKRSRKGKSTFILSRYTLSQMSTLDSYNSTKDIYDVSRMLDTRKYPAVISCRR